MFRSLAAGAAAAALFVAGAAQAAVQVHFAGVFDEVSVEGVSGPTIYNDQTWTLPLTWSLDMTLGEYGGDLGLGIGLSWFASSWTLTIGDTVYKHTDFPVNPLNGGYRSIDGISKIEIRIPPIEFAPSLPGAENAYFGVYSDSGAGPYLDNDPAHYTAGWAFEGIASTFDIQNGGSFVRYRNTGPLTEATIDGEFQGVFVPVPEPATWALMIAGFGAAGSMLRRQSRLMASPVVRS